MIEVITGLPDNVVAFRAKGHVIRKDYDDVLVPKVKEAFAKHRKIRCLYELGPEFSGVTPGAMWEDFKCGIEHLASWERIAVVTDVEWIRLAMNAFRFIMPGEVRLFGTGQAAEARRWIAA
jgi:SpoIIAA-like